MKKFEELTFDELIDSLEPLPEDWKKLGRERPTDPAEIALNDLRAEFGTAWAHFASGPQTLAEAQLPISQWQGLATLGIWLIGKGEVPLSDELGERIARVLFVFDDAHLSYLRHIEKDADMVRQTQGQNRYLYAGAKALQPHIEAFISEESGVALRKRYPLAEWAKDDEAQMEILRGLKF